MKARSRGCLLLAPLLLAAAFGGWAWWRLLRPYAAHGEEEKVVAVPEGMSARQILERLEAEGVLADSTLARFYLVAILGDPPLQAGEYRFRGPLTAPQALAKLVRGEIELASVTLVEGSSLDEAAAALARAGFGDQETFRRLGRNPAPIADLDPKARDLEGYLFPETYSFARGTRPEEIVHTLVATFRERFARAVEPRRAPPEEGLPALSLREFVTLASIVESEAQLHSERATIAAVYRNRLRIGMPLQADPTVIYALERRGAWNGNLRRDDLQLDDPYNTYRYPGLPPGPICSPGLASLQAAAAPADVPFLYFVSRNDGSHVFAATLAEHNRHVQEWQKRYWRERWARERNAGEGGG